jgi:OPA family sugar phosphate sensor protein UhpC-like MFS transporter
VEKEADQEFRYWRVRIFNAMFGGYALFYFTRKSFIFVMPALITDLGYTKSELGFLASILSISYAISKFLSGMLADRVNPRYLMGFGLMATGAINIAFGFSSSLTAFAILWGLNGVFQAFGAPPCARLLMHWFERKERGAWWSVWNTSHNIGGAAIPIIVGYCVTYGGWRFGMMVPGLICLLGGLILLNRLRDTPESLGLPPVEGGDTPVASEKLPLRVLLVENVLKNRWILLLGVSYFFVYVIRTAVNDWTALYLVEERGYQEFGASSVVSWFEIGGFFGSLVAGWASDKLFAGRRGPINLIFLAGTLGSLYIFWAFAGLSFYMDSAMVFLSGFLIFGPQMLVGMAAAEMTDKRSAATATGFVGCFAYMGAACAGYPLAKIAQTWGWDSYFISVMVCCVIAFLLLIPLWSLVSVPRDKEVASAPEPSAEEPQAALA